MLVRHGVAIANLSQKWPLLQRVLMSFATNQDAGAALAS
jgi:hypothetical protein